MILDQHVKHVGVGYTKTSNGHVWWCTVLDYKLLDDRNYRHSDSLIMRGALAKSIQPAGVEGQTWSLLIGGIKTRPRRGVWYSKKCLSAVMDTPCMGGDSFAGDPNPRPAEVDLPDSTEKKRAICPHCSPGFMVYGTVEGKTA